MILIGSSDPGAIKYFLEIYKELNSKVYFTYPTTAKKILIKKGIKNTSNWKNLKKIDLVITGASTGETLDKELIIWAKRKKITCISVIEHWTTFKERFRYKGRYLFPNKIFVNDLLAKKLAINCGINKDIIISIGNPILEKLSIKYKTKNMTRKIPYKKDNYIFLSEPIYESDLKKINKNKSLEFRTVEHLIEHLKKDTELTIKLHPREKKSKYNKYLKINKNIKIKSELSLASIANNYRYIIGIKTFLLFELYFLRHDIFSINLDGNNFVGEYLGVTKNIVHLNEIKNKIKFYKKIKFEEKFIGSKFKIIKKINQLKRKSIK